MSLFQWLTRRPRTEGSAIRTEAPKDRHDSEHPRSERSARREQLYSVVRDAMVRVSILSAGYKFKVLSLDNAGQRFVVMVDLDHAYAAEPARLREIEGLIAELAKARMAAIVHAVYWRVSEQLKPTKPPAEATASQSPLNSAVQQLHQARAARAAQPTRTLPRSFEPIDAQEMDAFRLAVAASGTIDVQHPRQSFASHGQHRSGPLLGPGTQGHEEARSDFHASDMGSLGVTQYGELR